MPSSSTTTNGGNYAQRQGRAHGLLFTAGPLSTSESVRAAQMDDYGSRDADFLQAVAEVRSEVLRIAHAPPAEWACVPMQGCGTMGMEAAINTFIRVDSLDANGASTTAVCPPMVLILRNGSYSHRMAAIVRQRCCGGGGGLPTSRATLLTYDWAEGDDIDLPAFDASMADVAEGCSSDGEGSGGRLALVGMVHSETSTGMINPIEEISAIIRKYFPVAPSSSYDGDNTTATAAAESPVILVDAMSSFGGYDIDIPAVADVLVTSANKCLQGVPGFSLVVARQSLLSRCRGHSPSFTLDVTKVWDGLERDGQFLFTPPVQAIVALRQAVRELWMEGGVTARAARYATLNSYVADRMTAPAARGGCGFRLFLDRSRPSYGYIITAFHSPDAAVTPRWDFDVFYAKLKEAGFVIYPGKASNANTFRIGTFGDITLADCAALMDTVVAVLAEMNVRL